MKIVRSKFVAAAALAVLIPFHSSSAGDEAQRSIVGVWLLEVTLRVCATGAPVPGIDPFPAMNTFHKGGTLTEFGARFSPSTRNVGQGVWKKEGRSTYKSRFVFHRFDAGGLHIGDQQVTRTSTLSPDGQWLTSEATVEIRDINGVVLMRGCATEEGPRLGL